MLVWSVVLVCARLMCVLAACMVVWLIVLDGVLPCDCVGSLFGVLDVACVSWFACVCDVWPVGGLVSSRVRGWLARVCVGFRVCLAVGVLGCWCDGLLACGLLAMIDSLID